MRVAKLSSALARLIELDGQETAQQHERAAFLALMDAVIEALPDALVVVDLEGKIVFFNQRAEFLFGYHRSEMIGQLVERLIPEYARGRHTHDRQQYSRFDVNQRAQTMGVGMDLAAVRNDGHEFAVDITLSRMLSPKGVLSLSLIRCSPRAAEPASVAQHPTERKQAINDFDA